MKKIDTLKGLEAGTSRYGAPATSASQACAVLRATALAHGIDLASASEVDLTAAAIAADAWALVLRVDSFKLPAQHGAPAVRALAAILARAAGCADEDLLATSEYCPSEPELLLAAESHARWAQISAGPLASQALRLAASDLSCAGPDSRLSSYAELLVIVAESLDHPEIFSKSRGY